ncbi:MAG: putative metallopeptidase [Candidatus Magnetobacterium sp. LHC-1]
MADTIDDYIEHGKPMQKLAYAIISKREDLQWILEYELEDKIGFVKSYEQKKTNSIVFADCRKVSGPFKAFVPYEVLITTYPPFEHLTPNQQKIVIWHELKHIGWSDEGTVKLNDHDVKDFYIILKKYGIDWDRHGQDVPDILMEEGGNNEE